MLQILAETSSIMELFLVFSGTKEIASGGRYDDLLKSLGAKKSIPAVGAQ